MAKALQIRPELKECFSVTGELPERIKTAAIATVLQQIASFLIQVIFRAYPVTLLWFSAPLSLILISFRSVLVSHSLTPAYFAFAP